MRVGFHSSLPHGARWGIWQPHREDGRDPERPVPIGSWQWRPSYAATFNVPLSLSCLGKPGAAKALQFPDFPKAINSLHTHLPLPSQKNIYPPFTSGVWTGSACVCVVGCVRQPLVPVNSSESNGRLRPATGLTPWSCPNVAGNDGCKTMTLFDCGLLFEMKCQRHSLAVRFHAMQACSRRLQRETMISPEIVASPPLGTSP